MLSSKDIQRYILVLSSEDSTILCIDSVLFIEDNINHIVIYVH